MSPSKFVYAVLTASFLCLATFNPHAFGDNLSLPVPGISRDNMPAPALTISLRDKTSFSLGPSESVTVVNLWATWCAPCVEEIPSLERLRKQVSALPIVILAVSMDESWDEVDKLLNNRPFRGLLSLDPNRTVAKAFGTEKFPETFIVDKKGIVRRKLIGSQVWDRGDFVNYLKTMARE